MTLCIERLREAIQYDPETGRLFWRSRPAEHFKSEQEYKRWNGRYAGKEGFTSRNSGGYFFGQVFGVRISAHRVAYAITHGVWPDEVDHINGDRADNRISNLRGVTRSINQRNASRRTDNRSGVAGVYWHRRDKVWRAKIGNRQLGTFGDFETAVAARWAAEAENGYSGRNRDGGIDA